MFQDFVLSVLTNSLLKFFFPKNESSSQNREPKMLIKFQAVVSYVGRGGALYIQYTSYTNKNKNYGI